MANVIQQVFTPPPDATNGGEQGPSSPGNPNGDAGSNYSSFQWLLAWTVLIVVLVFLARTRIGYLLIYYALALAIIFLLVTQYKWFAGVLAPFSSLRPGVVAPSGASEHGTAPSESQASQASQ